MNSVVRKKPGNTILLKVEGKEEKNYVTSFYEVMKTTFLTSFSEKSACRF